MANLITDRKLIAETKGIIQMLEGLNGQLQDDDRRKSAFLKAIRELEAVTSPLTEKEEAYFEKNADTLVGRFKECTFDDLCDYESVMTVADRRMVIEDLKEYEAYMNS